MNSIFAQPMRIYMLAMFLTVAVSAHAQLYVGSAYYPEQLPESQVAVDADMMSEAGLNLARMGDFAWSTLEPTEGKYDFARLDHAVATLAGRGVSTLLCTPTAAIPKWMADARPDIMMVREDGVRKPYGRRRHACYNNEAYREYCLRIVRNMAEHYKDNSAVVGFQIDNELTTEDPYCYCESCRKCFVKWLSKRYGTVERLNNAWGTSFWSETLNSFDQAWLPRSMDNPAAYLDYRRFVSDCTLDFFRMKRDVIKSVSPRMKCTANVGGGGFVTTIDLYRLGRECDVLAVDNYPVNCTVESLYDNNNGEQFEPSMVSFALQQIRGGRDEHIWVTEEQVGRTALTQREIVPDGYVRLWTHQQAAYGCDMSVFFPFRAFGTAHEHLMAGVVESDGVKRDKYYEIQRTAGELRTLHGITGLLLPSARAAVIRDFDADHVFDLGYTFCPDFKYLREVYAYYKALRAEAIMTDMVSPEADLGQYDIIVAPYLALADARLASALEERARAGASVVLTCLTGVRDCDFHKYDGLVCRELQQLAGIEIERQEALFGRKFNTFRYGDSTARCSYWFDKIRPVDAEVLACYDGPYFTGSPAVCVRGLGNGRVYYVATVPEAGTTSRFMSKVVADAGLKPVAGPSDVRVEIAELHDGKGQRYIYLVNFDDKEARVPLGVAASDVLTDEPFIGSVDVEALGFRLMRIK